MRAVMISTALATALLNGCDSATDTSSRQRIVERDSLAEKIGQNCTIQFRRGDALGAGDNLPVPPTTDSINGVDVSIGGELLAVSEEWIAVESVNKECWIPRKSILLVQFNK